MGQIRLTERQFGVYRIMGGNIGYFQAESIFATEPETTLY